jgi:cytochrome bd-type quinol oxidase subunit 2
MLQGFFAYLGELPVSKAIGESLWIYPMIQAVHLVFLAILIGALLIVDLRLLGRGMIRQSVAQVARDAWPWFLIGIVGMVVTGVPQLMQNALREYYSEFFWQKMYFLAAALIFTFTVRMYVTRHEGVAPVMQKITALVSIFLWMNVAIAGRLIGLFT